MDYTIFEARPGLALLLLPDAPMFTIVAVSNDYLNFFGLKKEEVIGRSHFDLFTPENDQSVITVPEILRESYEHVIGQKIPHQHSLPGGSLPVIAGEHLPEFWQSHNVPVLNEMQEVCFLIHTLSSKTEQVVSTKNGEAKSVLEKMYNFFKQVPVIIGFVSGDDYVIELANEGLLEVWGRTDEVVGKPLLQAIPELAEQGFIQLLDQVRLTGNAFYAYEHPITLNRKGNVEVLYFDFVYKAYYKGEKLGKADGVIAVGHEVTEQVKSRSILKESSEELELAVEIADLGTFRVDLLRNISTNSPKVSEWFGFGIKENTIEEAFSPIHPEDRQRVEAVITGTLHSELNSRHDVTYKVMHPVNGTVRHLRSFGKTLFNENNKPYLIIGIIQDITRQILYQKQLEETEVALQQRVLDRTVELENLNRELVRSNDDLEQFAYAASHDLKEPIRKINLFADRLKQSLVVELSEEQNRYFNRMEQAVKRMNLLIDDLLTYSHISSGSFNKELVDLNLKIAKVLEDLEVEIEEKNAVVTVGNLPVITANKLQAKQLFHNLVTNALKYSKPGLRPEINISSRKIWGHEANLVLNAEQAATEYWLIQIVDNGIGFEPEEAEKIFNVFTRLHGTEVYKGTGVGLSISRKVVANQNGHIWAESQPGKGATFNILFPVD